jgi:hypothetical protein
MAQPITNLLINGLNPVTVGGTGTAIKYFPYLPGASIGVASTKSGFLMIPGNAEANAQRMEVRAVGNFSIGNNAPAASPAVTLALYPVTFPDQIASIANSNANQQNTASTAVIGATAIVSQTFAAASDKVGTAQPWSLSAVLAGDSLSGLVQLVGGDIVMDGTAGTVTAGLVSGLSGINFSNVVPFALVIGVTFSVSDAAASANMYQFQLSL